MKTRTIKQSVIIKATPEKVYQAFMNEKRHKEFTGYNARIYNKVGGKFITCGNRNFGYSLYLKSGKRIVQAWSQKHFPDNQYSIIDIKLNKLKRGYTRLVFQQTGAPLEAVKWLIPGWKSTYWNPLKNYLEKGIIQKLRD